IEMFRDRLNRSGIVSTIRASRGEDIMAACGMLSGSK
ncbi:MAG: 23S rRNA (adenine(2503)-C(2))-methyltransferase RlmN, partial [Bacteroidales bacterium]|nr:23S rRNA (adenine(2503)-C(2))-methyltransferase RlmN [Bacteroidales bacterium]